MSPRPPPRIRRSDLPPAVPALCERLRAHGHRAWIVGGCVRDLLMGRKGDDWDLCTSARPEEVQRIFRRTIPTGIDHGTVTVLFQGTPYEVTTLRGDGAYSDGRRPDTVAYVLEIEEDLARRDFTVNAIAFDPIEEALVDPWDGLSDLEAGVLRAVGEPARRFGEDGLRVLRAARFSASLEFEIDPATEAAIRPSLDTYRKVAPERVQQEWLKTLKARRPGRAFEVMRRTGILEIACPPLFALGEAAWARTLRRLNRAGGSKDGVEVALVALFYELEEAEIIEAWMSEYRFSNAQKKAALHLHAHRSIEALSGLDRAGVRRKLSAVVRDSSGVENLNRLLALARAEATEPEQAAEVARFEATARAELEAEAPLSVRDLAVGGKELMAHLGRPPGRWLGLLLEELLRIVLDTPEENERERLLAHADRISARPEGAR